MPIIISPGTVVDSAGIGAYCTFGCKYFIRPGIIHCVGDPVSGHSSEHSPNKRYRYRIDKGDCRGRPVAVLGLSLLLALAVVTTF